jgi:hypothetical protein
VTDRLKRVLPALTVTAVALILTIRLFTFISDYSVNVLYQDQWDYLDPLFQGHAGLVRLFLFQHGPHREGLGLIADSFLYPLTNWNARAESFLAGLCVLAAMLLALLLKYRLFGRLSYGDVAIPLIFLTPAQHETFLGAANAAYSAIPLLLTMLYCLSLQIGRYWLRYVVCLALNFLLIFTGFGIFMGVVTIGVFALECYWRWRGMSLAALIAACASLGSFFIGYRPDPAVDCFVFPYHDLLAYPRFTALMAARFAGLMTPVRLAEAVGALAMLGAAAVVSILAWRIVKARRFGNRQLVAAVLLAFSILFSVNAAVGRVCLGLPGAAWPPRYVTLLIPGVLAFYLCLQSLDRSGIRRTLIGAFLLLLIPGYVIVDPIAGWYAQGKRAWADCYLATESVSSCNKVFAIHPRPEETRLKEKLDYLKEHRLNLYSSDDTQRSRFRF